MSKKGEALFAGDVVYQRGNNTMWLIYQSHPCRGECVVPGNSNYVVGSRGMPFVGTGYRGVEVVPEDKIPEHLLPRIALLRLLGHEPNDD